METVIKHNCGEKAPCGLSKLHNISRLGGGQQRPYTEVFYNWLKGIVIRRIRNCMTCSGLRCQFLPFKACSTIKLNKCRMLIVDCYKASCCCYIMRAGTAMPFLKARRGSSKITRAQKKQKGSKYRGWKRGQGEIISCMMQDVLMHAARG